MQPVYEVIVIGAGQAGIAMSQQLQSDGIDNHIMLDNHKRIGDSWRLRYTSLVLFTPRSYSSLPRLEMNGDPESFPTKDEMADYLETYVEHFQLPYQLGVKVIKVEKQANYFEVHTSQGILNANQVVVASGAFQQPYVPSVIENDAATSHLHTSEYKDSSSLNSGSVLIVGGGNSGAQIAVELSNICEVTLSISHQPKFLPLKVVGKSIFNWLEKLRLLYAGTDTKRGKLFQKQNDPIFGKELKQAIRRKQVKIKPRVIKVDGANVTFKDGSKLQADQVIWATGFTPSYKMIDIEGAIDENGKPLHKRGVSPIDGLYYIGLPWQHSRGSALICGVGKDSEYLMRQLKS
ncbi:NAD(P)/FAD-dependent oxidoreductase [Geomicrobium sp. JCM 19055]|uniref:flavin-containing monooxygenase n=1 Tax=Geomicrobium sp. JCM 19055 TaxID=1460649 RepID=UPI00045ED0D0|nr:NAD(P)/FAD-dependent oxidoreductase [Geomicrobium sp. JCM 19055]GAJ99802.1 monooxygenase [Geomicrobium sp. JCM 19055]